MCDGKTPWILLSQCGIGNVSSQTGQLVSVACPSWLCNGLIPLIDGKIASHHAQENERCPWSGTRVHDDRAATCEAAASVVRIS